jgi:hypothetical protein
MPLNRNMDMYLLLRNNKQSGPYSLEELKTMGLKAYDLVWLEGRSAAWRYPCELEELSAFAPPVEEQPFDRFYKKPAVTATATATAPSPVVLATTPAPTTPQYTGEPSAVPGKRIIYVTMPAGRTPAPMREIPRETPKEPVYRPQTAQAPVPAPGASVHDSPMPEDYSAQTPSLEEQLVEFSPHLSISASSTRSSFAAFSSRSSKRNNERILRPLAIGGCILALLAAGIFIGLSLNKENLGFRQKIAAKTPVKDSEQATLHPTTQQPPVSATTPAVTGTSPGKSTNDVDQNAGINRKVSATPPPVNKPPRLTTPKQKPSAPKKEAIPPPVTKDSAAGTIPVVHREAAHRSDIVETKTDNIADKEAAKTSIATQVSVGANGYTVGTFGGINDLQLTVTNRSVYPLDLVVVEVQYIQANKKVYKKENLYFHSIGAGSALMQEAPKSSRGIKVQYKIITISSKELGLSYSGI